MKSDAKVQISEQNAIFFSHVFPYAFLFPQSFPTMDIGLVAIVVFRNFARLLKTT